MCFYLIQLHVTQDYYILGFRPALMCMDSFPGVSLRSAPGCSMSRFQRNTMYDLIPTV